MMSYETDNCNNNLVIGEPLTKSINDNIPSEFQQQEESEKQIAVDNMVRFNVNQDQDMSKAEGDMAIMNYAYDPGLVETSVICDLGFRNIDSLDDELTQDDLLNLMEKTYTKLSLTHNCLQKIPYGFFRKYPRLEHLSVLDLSCNQLEYLPNDIGLLTSLTYLNLFLNNLRCLPSSMGGLSNLKWLNLNKNPDLFKTSYFRILAGPMSNDKECFTCAKNVVLWINQVNEGRLNAYEMKYESLGNDMKPLRDSHLIQDGPQETNEHQPIPTTCCSKVKSFVYCCVAFTGIVGILIYFVLHNK